MTAINRSISTADPNAVTAENIAGLEEASLPALKSEQVPDQHQISEPPVYRASSTEAAARKAEANILGISNRAQLNNQLQTKKASGKELISLDSAVKGHEREV